MSAPQIPGLSSQQSAELDELLLQGKRIAAATLLREYVQIDLKAVTDLLYEREQYLGVGPA